MIDEERREAAIKQMKAMLDRLDQHLCMVCGKPVETYDQVGRCVYADPCGHRQYQGKAPEKEKA